MYCTYTLDHKYFTYYAVTRATSVLTSEDTEIMSSVFCYYRLLHIVVFKVDSDIN